MKPLSLAATDFLGGESEGVSEDTARETIVPKSTFTPNDASLGYLRSNPDTFQDFDAKYGVGSSARYLSEPPKPENVEPEPVEIDTSHILRSMEPETDVPGEIYSQANARRALDASKRDIAIIQSLDRAKGQSFDWNVEDAVRSAESNVETWSTWKRENKNPRLDQAYSDGLKAALARREMTLEAQALQPGWLPDQIKKARAEKEKADGALAQEMRKGLVANSTHAASLLARDRWLEFKRIEEDQANGVRRNLSPRDRVRAAELLSMAKTNVVAAEDALEAAKADPNLGETGRSVDFYEDQLKDAKARQFHAQRAYDYGATIKAPDDPTLIGEYANSAVQSAIGISGLLIGKGFEHYGDIAEQWGAEGASNAMRGPAEALGYIVQDFERNNVHAYEGPSFYDMASPTFWSQPGAKRKATHWLVHSLGQVTGTGGAIFAGYAAGGMIGGGSVGLTMGVGEARNTLEEAFAEQGLEYDPDKHGHYVSAYGAAIGALDTAAAGFLISRVTGDVKQKAVKHVARAYAAGIAKGLAAEGLTEAAQEALNEILAWHAADKKIDPAEFTKRVVDAFGVGAVGGAAFSAATIPPRLREEKDMGELLAQMTPEERQAFTSQVGDGIVKELQEEAKAEAEKTGTGREAVEAEALKPVPEEKKVEPIKPDPGQDAMSYIRERGGIRDEGGDLANIGAPKSIISEKGLSPDQMREALVEGGYITETGNLTGGEAQTTAQDVYDLVQRSLAGEKVFAQGTDAAVELATYEKNKSVLESEEASQILRDLQGTLEANEIPYNLTDAEEARIVQMVREESLDPFDALEKLTVDRYNKGGLRRESVQGGAPQASAPFPSIGTGRTQTGRTSQTPSDGTPRRVSGGTVRALADYLREGGSLSAKARGEIAEKTGLEPNEVQELFDLAEAEGVIKKDRRGRYRRGPSFETYHGLPDLDLRAAQTASLENGDAARRMVQALRQKKTFHVPTADVDGIVEALEPSMHMVPEGSHVAVAESFQPLHEITFKGKPDTAVAVHSRAPNGESITAFLPLSMVEQARALFIPDGGIPGVSGSSVLFLSKSRIGEADSLFSGGLHHELVHLYVREGLFEAGDYSALVARAHDLKILDMEVGTVLQAVGDPTSGFARGGRTLRLEYEELYAGRADIQDYLDQEAVAYLIELSHHNYWNPEELAPVQGIIARFEAGVFAGKGEAGQGEVSFAISGVSPQDSIGFYSKALEAARGLKQAKGTPEQMRAQLRSSGVKEAELQAVGLDEFLSGKKSVTREEIVSHLENNRVEVRETSYGTVQEPSWVGPFARTVNMLPERIADRLADYATPLADRQFAQNLKNSGYAGEAKWQSYSLDPSNPTYRETVLHLPAKPQDESKLGPAGWNETHNANSRAGDVNFQSGHWSEPSVIAHARTSIQKDSSGNDVFVINELQSDWGQKLRDGGVRDEAKAKALRAREAELKAELSPDTVKELDNFDYDYEPLVEQLPKYPNTKYRKIYDELVAFGPEKGAELQRVRAEAFGAETGASGHPLVNTTDQWVDVGLKRMIRQAVESDADQIAIPSGETVKAFGMGGEESGLKYAYDQMYPKNLRNLLRKMDKSVEGQKVDHLFGQKGEKLDRSHGFTTFKITDAIRQKVKGEGMPLFALSGRQMAGGQTRVPSPGVEAPAKSISELVQDLNKALGLITRHGRLNPGLKAMAGKSGGKLQGQHNAATGVTRLALPEDIETLSHEGGHALEVRFGVPLRTLMTQHALELEPLATPGKDSLSEGFAEYFRRYVTNPSAAENVAPNFTNDFDDFLDRQEPGLRDALEQIQVGYQEWIDAPSGGVVMSEVQSSKEPGLIKRFTEKYRTRGFRDAAKEDLDKIYTSTIDDLHPVKVAVDRLIEIANQNMKVALQSGQKIGVTAANDAYKLLRLARNGYQAGHMALMRGVKSYHGTRFSGPSYRDALGHAFGGFEANNWSEANQKAFNGYLVARRMVREWDRFRAGEITNPPDKLSRADHEQAVQDLEQTNPRFRQAADMLYGYQKNLLTLAHDAGILTDEAYQTYVSRSDYYVPVQRVMDDEKAPGGTFSDQNSRSPIKRFKGSTRDIVRPTESIAKFTYELHYMIARNDAIKALDALARAAGPGGGAIAERIPASQMKGTKVDAIEVIKQAGKQQGLDELDIMHMAQAVEDTLGEDTTTTIFRPGEINELGEPIIYLWENGKRVPIRLPDAEFGREVFESITGLGKEWTGLFVNTLALPTQALRAGVTLDPAFLAANFFRDNVAAWIMTEDFTPFVTGVKSTYETGKGAFGGDAANLDLANSMGLIMGGEGVSAIHEARVKRDVEKLRRKGIRIRDAANPFNKKFWELTGLTETGTRLGVFRNARLRGLNDGLSEYEAIVEAAYTANDMIDFGRSGSKMLAVRRLVTFLNAALQGMEKTVRVISGKSENPRVIRDVISPYIKSRTGQPLSVMERKKVSVAAKAYAKLASLGLIGLAMSLLYRDDEEYQEIPEYFRTTHWMIKAADGTWIRIPKPFELAAFSNIMERAFERAYHGDEAAMERMRTSLFDLVVPPHTVPGVQTAYELWANKSAFSGMPIVPDRLLGLDPEMQFTEYTSEFSKKLAQWTGIPAAKLDHAIMGVTGGLGRTGLSLSDQAFSALGASKTPRPEMRMEEAPFLRRFTLDPARSSQSKQNFWRQMGMTDGELARVANSYKELWDRGQRLEAQTLLDNRSEEQKVYALLEGHATANEKRMHPMNRARDVISVTSGIRREIDTGELTQSSRAQYSPSDRRVINEIIEMIQMREARNALITIEAPGFKHLRVLDVEPVMEELRSKSPDLYDELQIRLAERKVRDFETVRAEWPDLKARVLEPNFADDRPSRRKSGRRSGYDLELSP